MDSSVDHTSSIGAVFFDLDKTIIAKSSAQAFGRPFHRGGPIGVRDVLLSTYAQMRFRMAGADHVRMGRMRRYVSEPCTGWSVQQVTAIADETPHGSPMLEAVGHPHAVDPDRAPRRRAARAPAVSV